MTSLDPILHGATISWDDSTLTIRSSADGVERTFNAPCAGEVLAKRYFTADPPHAHELTNAIGDVLDHLEDATRELDDLEQQTEVRLVGERAHVIAAVEFGGQPGDSSYLITRDAAEEVFRTVATEATEQRRHNPGLPESHVATIVADCCVVVAIMRGLSLSAVTVDLARS